MAGLGRETGAFHPPGYGECTLLRIPDLGAHARHSTVAGPDLSGC